MGQGYLKVSLGKGCFIPIIWDSGCSKSIVSEEAVCTLSAQIHELHKSLMIISASGDSLRILGTADVFITRQVIGKKKELLQGTALGLNKQNPKILVLLEIKKRLKIVQQAFGLQTIDDFLFNQQTIENKYSEKYNCNIIQFYFANLQSQKSKSLQERKMSFVTN